MITGATLLNYRKRYSTKKYFQKLPENSVFTDKCLYVEDIAVRKQGHAILMAVIMVFALTGCGNKSLLSAKEPVELTMWHVYGEQAGSPMDTLVEEFNRTEGKEKGVRVR